MIPKYSKLHLMTIKQIHASRMKATMWDNSKCVTNTEFTWWGLEMDFEPLPERYSGAWSAAICKESTGSKGPSSITPVEVSSIESRAWVKLTSPTWLGEWSSTMLHSASGSLVSTFEPGSAVANSASQISIFKFTTNTTAIEVSEITPVVNFRIFVTVLCYTSLASCSLLNFPL